MSENKGKYNIDELVNTLLLERQPSLPRIKPDLDLYDAEDEEELFILDPIDESTSDSDEDVDEDDEPVQLLGFDELGEASAEMLDEEQVFEDEVFVPHIIELEDETAEAVDAPMVENLPEVVPEPVKPQTTPIVSSEPQPMPQTKPEKEPEVEPAKAPPKKRKRLFSRKIEDTATIERSWLDWGLKPLGQSQEDADAVPQAETVAKVDAVSPVATNSDDKCHGMDEIPAVTAVKETITMPVVLPSGVTLPGSEERTRVLPVVKAEAVAQLTTDEELPIVGDDEQLPDQLSLEEMVRVEDMEPSEEKLTENDELEDPEERLQRTREEKVREFTLDGDEEELNDPEEEPEEEETEEEIQDFTGYQDTQVVAKELKYRCRSSLLSAIFSGVLELGLLLLTLISVVVEQSPIPMVGYLVAHLFGIILMMGLNYSTITRGLSGLFSLRANNDSAPALATTICLFDVILHFINPDAPLPFWTPIAGLLLLLSAIAHHAQEVCVRRNFAFVSYPGDKYAAAVIQEDNALQEIGRRAVSDGDAKVAYFRRTEFLSDYLTNAYDEDYGDDWSRWLTPIAFGLSAILSIVALFSEHVTGFWDWLSVFTGMVCLSMPVSLLAVQTALSGSCRRMLSRGGFLNGWQAVRQFGTPDALAVDIADLYPDESMVLHGIKTFFNAHIDEAILMAASLAVRSGGPLAMIFRRIIENKEELLYEVDSLVYEQGMGLSGWVDGRRVFVGNGRLLQNHGIDVPSSDYEARYAKDGRRLVYVAIAGQLSAMFVVSYLPDPEIQVALQELCRSRVTLLVRSCDPNISTSDLCESFDLDEYYVDVLPAAAGRVFVQLTEGISENLPAVMASNGHILGTARALFACRGIRIKTILALLIQSISAGLGLLFCLLWTMNGTLSLFQPLLLILVSLFVTWFVPLFRRT